MTLLTMPAHAQWVPVGKTSHWGPPVGQPLGGKGGKLLNKRPDERLERAYRSSADRIPAKKANPDPWHSVREPQAK